MVVAAAAASISPLRSPYTSPRASTTSRSPLGGSSYQPKKRPRIGRFICGVQVLLALILSLYVSVLTTFRDGTNDSSSMDSSTSRRDPAKVVIRSQSRGLFHSKNDTRIERPLTGNIRSSPQQSVYTVNRSSTTIAFAVTITGCAPKNSNITTEQSASSSSDLPETPAFQIEDSAAILHYAIHRHSMHGDRGGRYDYQLYAIYHPQARSCVGPLEDLGYTLLERDTPVKVQDIQGEFLREKISGNGCCGEKELIKFEAFTLSDHPIVVLLDLDVIIMKPLDELFDWMIHGKRAPDHHLMWPDRPVPDDVRLFYTIDYAMVNPERKVKPAQGGYMIFKPNQKVYDDIMAIVRKGNYGARGWDGKTGKFWGSMTFQGLIPFYFFILHPGNAVELNWCIHDNMVSPPVEGAVRPGANTGKCFTNTETCEDCRKRPISEIYSAHFTVCQKPWLCNRHLNKQDPRSGLCRQLDHEWYQLRSEMEKSWGRSGQGSGPGWHGASHFYGYCHSYRQKGYERIQPPFGKPLVGTQVA